MMEQRRNSRKGFEKRKDHRLQAFRGPPPRDNQHEEHHDRVKRARRRSPSREPTLERSDYKQEPIEEPFNDPDGYMHSEERLPMEAVK
jgi:stress response protein YsnF